MVPYVASIPGTQVRFEMTPVPGGVLTVRGGDPTKTVRIEVPPFWMGTHEVTWQEYVEYMDAYDSFQEFEHRRTRQIDPTNRLDAVTAPTPIYEYMYRMEFATSARQPAATMTQFAARQYTKWLSLMAGDQYRLPTEAEWRYACQAGTDTRWSCGDDPQQLEQYAVFSSPGEDEGPLPVGSKKANPWGLHDMHGNVAEWIIDGHHSAGLARLDSGVHSLQEAIHWPRQRFSHVVCGGGWADTAANCQTYSRSMSTKDWWREDPNIPLSPWWLAADGYHRAVGFRLVRSLADHTPQQMRRFWDADSTQLAEDVQARIEEGRGIRGLADPALPTATKELGQPSPPWLRPWLKREEGR